MRTCVVAIALFALVCVASALVPAPTFPVPNPLKTCTDDKDCVAVPVTCCNSECEFDVVNAIYADSYALDCTGLHCPTYNCETTVGCVAYDKGSLCTVKPGKGSEIETDIDPVDLSCKESSDCQLVNQACCGCDYIAVNSQASSKYSHNCLAVVCPSLQKRNECADIYRADCQSEQCVVVSGSPTIDCKDLEVYQCTIDPCEGAQCDAYPNAVCYANYCGGCKAEFKHNGAIVNCTKLDSNLATPSSLSKTNPCDSLPCDKCADVDGCAFCSGSYLSSNSKSVSIGVCVPESTTSKCNLLLNSAISTSPDACPDNGGSDTGSNSETVPDQKPEQTVFDTTSIQKEVDSAESSVTSKYTIVITFVVKVVEKAVNSYKMFVDLTGDGSPTEEETNQVCEILKNSLLKADVSIPPTVIIKCELTLQPAPKRSASYIAELSFSDPDAASASAIFISFSAVVLAVMAVLV